MRDAHTSLLSHAMEVRPHSQPERTGRYKTGTLSDGTVVDAAILDAVLGRDIYTDSKSSIDRLITRGTQRLADSRENLKDRLDNYIELRSVLKWKPNNMAYLTFADRLKSFATWPRRTELPTPESLAEAGFYYTGMYTSC